MYRKILVALENGPADTSLLPHIAELARQLGSRLLLVHVADGWAARHYDQLKLAESEEMRLDREYLDAVAERWRATGLIVEVQLALGDPPTEILRAAERERCDLIAMTTHGHRLLGDLIHGSTISEVRHRATTPILLVRAGMPAPPDR
jgi:nucleotide-binding universal stress UspA family protein